MAQGRPLPPSSRWLTAKRVSGVTVLTFTRADLLDEETAREIRGQLFRLLEDAGDRRFVVDFSAVHTFSSSLLTGLIAFNKGVRKAGGDLALCALAPELAQKIETMRLLPFFRICAGEQEAVQAVSAQPG